MMSDTWNDAMILEFVDEVKDAVKEIMKDHNTDDPYECAEDIGREVLNLLYEYFGSPEEWDKDDDWDD